MKSEKNQKSSFTLPPPEFFTADANFSRKYAFYHEEAEKITLSSFSYEELGKLSILSTIFEEVSDSYF
jgi:hypothetical protein